MTPKGDAIHPSWGDSDPKRLPPPLRGQSEASPRCHCHPIVTPLSPSVLPQACLPPDPPGAVTIICGEAEDALLYALPPPGTAGTALPPPGALGTPGTPGDLVAPPTAGDTAALGGVTELGTPPK